MKPKLAAKVDDKAALSTEGLQQEVSAFASQLGLFAGGESNGFNDADFRPEKAAKQIGAKKVRSKPSKPEDEQVKQLQQRLESSKGAGPSDEHGRYSREDPEKMAAVKGRTWKAGSGTRPGEKVGKTLVGKDEATVWYEALDALPRLPGNGGARVAADEFLLEKLRNEGEVALENEAAVFEQDLNKKNRADSRWLQQVRQSGTTADKLAAMTLLLQESAVANLRSLDELMKWVGKRSGARGVAAQAIDALKELFTTILLPDRKLFFFEQQPLGALPEGKEGSRRLLYYYMEDAVKKRYLQFAKDLQEASRDNLAFIKEKSIKAMYDLLCAKPEQEAFLLTCLVDKLGDPSRKIASNAGYLLGQLLEEHPAMNLVVAQEAERFLFKPYTPARAVYYGVVFLNQIVLSKRQDKGGSALAKKLISIYFTLFQLILEGKVGHAHELKVSQEAQQAARGKGGAKKGPQKKKQRWKPRPGGGKGVPGVANTLKQRTTNQAPQPSSQGASVDAKLLGGLLAGIRRAFPFVDSSETEALMEQHSTALFRVTHTATFGVAVQALGLVFQLLDARSAVSDRFYRALYGMLLHPDLARSNKSAMFLSLLYKAMKADISNQRILAFIKRLLQVAASQMPNFTCGCLLLVSEVLKDRGALWGPILEAEDAGDDVERFDDADTVVVTSAAQAANKLAPKDLARFDDASDDEQAADVPGGKKNATPRQEDEDQGYDMRKRDPRFARAERSCVWELVLLAEHVHPSVAAMTRALLSGVAIEYAGDPMRDMSTSAFLDKFVQKKAKVHTKGTSLMQPAKPLLSELATPAFAALSAADATPDTAYFHKFFEVKAQREAAGVRPKSKRRAKKEAEVGPLASDEDSLAGSDAESDEIDDFMDHMEDSEDEAAPRGYDDLAAAMAADGAESSASDEAANRGSGEDEEGQESGSSEGGRSSGSGGSVDSDAMFGDSSDDEESNSDEGVPEDINVFELPDPSDEDSSSGDVEEDGAESDDEGEWVMADPPEAQIGMEGKRKAGPSPKGRITQPKQKRRGDNANVFAAAEEYADLLHEDSVEALKEFTPGANKSRTKRRRTNA